MQVSIVEQVVFEDNHLIGINKRAGQLVQPDNDFTEESLEDYVKEYVRVKYKKPGDAFLGVIHRLDRPVSGLVLFARTSKALERMNKLFSSRQIDKTYYALVHGKPKEPEGNLVHYLVKDTDRNITQAYNNNKRGNGVRAELNYKVIRIGGDFCLLEVHPLTGRPHQIRVQLSKIGHPIVGDLKYGSDKTNPDRSICLHALALEFIHPVKKEPIRIEAPMGDDHLIYLYIDQ
ncbi:MAG: RNA pseudouridine synthase [Bacteroidetes bacterium]|nr:RNA pseudouridine synthase [Bacteroidota bacterium]